VNGALSPEVQKKLMDSVNARDRIAPPILARESRGAIPQNWRVDFWSRKEPCRDARSSKCQGERRWIAAWPSSLRPSRAAGDFAQVA
jgi:hypothetical protein